MPGYDRTGPMGMGPRTGRGLGYCNGYGPGYGGFGRGYGRGFGRGYGRGFGRGHGRGWGYGAVPYPYPAYPLDYGTLDPAAEQEWLESEAKAMERNLSDIRKRLDELAKKEEKS
ncbi:MAG: DUF5320 domain-containing protein [Deltaproteobacteria bacterium]|nr:DUF5320 domain-containing protein [Deltaproteobacteria bacterium]